ncbi:MAG TPA: tRNA pseudouridine(38-40) synthase TruA [Propionibacteriaceae bacterium]|nr:tRNA pseudouridine(38-40) synthase TruA [Propionibacteriaceae bacterium]
MTPTARFRLDLAYDGTAFSGWATQPGLRTVQGELETWIPRVLRLDTPTPVTVAGRTDAGVHARGQVAHVDLPAEFSAAREGAGPTGPLLFRRLSRVLPDDVVVRAVAPAQTGFDARFSAIWRRYVYRIWDAPELADPLRRNHVATVRHSLNLAAMSTAGASLLGLHDFAAFCKPRDGATTIRTLDRLTIDRSTDGTIEIEVRADAFCHSMVRSLVGALVAVGNGTRDQEWLAGLIDRTQRSGEIHVMAAHGLTLEEVGYPAESELAARALEARAVRTLPEEQR